MWQKYAVWRPCSVHWKLRRTFDPSESILHSKYTQTNAQSPLNSYTCLTFILFICTHKKSVFHTHTHTHMCTYTHIHTQTNKYFLFLQLLHDGCSFAMHESLSTAKRKVSASTINSQLSVCNMFRGIKSFVFMYFLFPKLSQTASTEAVNIQGGDKLIHLKKNNFGSRWQEEKVREFITRRTDDTNFSHKYCLTGDWMYGTHDVVVKWLRYAVQGVFMAWFGSTCSLRGKDTGFLKHFYLDRSLMSIKTMWIICCGLQSHHTLWEKTWHLCQAALSAFLTTNLYAHFQFSCKKKTWVGKVKTLQTILRCRGGVFNKKNMTYKKHVTYTSLRWRE